MPNPIPNSRHGPPNSKLKFKFKVKSSIYISKLNG